MTVAAQGGSKTVATAEQRHRHAASGWAAGRRTPHLLTRCSKHSREEYSPSSILWSPYSIVLSETARSTHTVGRQIMFREESRAGELYDLPAALRGIIEFHQLAEVKYGLGRNQRTREVRKQTGYARV